MSLWPFVTRKTYERDVQLAATRTPTTATVSDAQVLLVVKAIDTAAKQIVDAIWATDATP